MGRGGKSAEELDDVHVFVVWREDGSFWTGEDWAPSLAQAQRFIPRGDANAYTECSETVVVLRAGGAVCNVGAAKVRKSRADQSLGRVAQGQASGTI